MEGNVHYISIKIEPIDEEDYYPEEFSFAPTEGDFPKIKAESDPNDEIPSSIPVQGREISNDSLENSSLTTDEHLQSGSPTEETITFDYPQGEPTIKTCDIKVEKDAENTDIQCQSTDSLEEEKATDLISHVTTTTSVTPDNALHNSESHVSRNEAFENCNNSTNNETTDGKDNELCDGLVIVKKEKDLPEETSTGNADESSVENRGEGYLEPHVILHTDEVNRNEEQSEPILPVNQEGTNLGTDGNPENRCAICGKSFHRKKNLRMHMQCHSDVKSFVCTFCHKSFNHNTSLRNHLRIHTGETPYACSQCDKSFGSRTSLRSHLLTHSSGRETACNICGKIFSCPEYVKRHIAWTHEATSKPKTPSNTSVDEEMVYSCVVCNKDFRMLSNLRKHLRIHEEGNEPRHTCDVCQKSFSSKKCLKSHSFMHTGNSPYRCSVCSKSFGTPGNLTIHMRTHLEEKPHPCETCKRTFPTPSALKKHKLKHTGERPYTCNFCQKSFFDSYVLKNHILIHTGEKPHRCDVCKKAFTQAASLRKHQLIHTGERTHHCRQCEKSFKLEYQLQAHLRTHKNENSNNQPDVSNFIKVEIAD